MFKRLTFPLFNSLIAAMLGALVGYYVFRPWQWAGLAALGGLGIGLAVDFLFGLGGTDRWLYRRRVLATVLVEIPLAVFVAGPYAATLLQTAPDHHPVCCETPLDFGAPSYENVRIEAAAGITLAGWFVPPQERPGPVVVLLHGSRGDRLQMRWHAGQLIGAGYGVLLYDQRGLGESTGEQVTLGWEDGGDLLAAAAWLAGRPEVDPDRLGVVGLSLGAQIALNAAYGDPAALAALWLDGTQAQTEVDLPDAGNAGERFATFVNRLLIDAAERQLGRPAPPPFEEIIPALTEPRLYLVAAGLDEVERRINAQYELLLGPNGDFWLIENAWHVGGPAVVPDEYAARMLAFFGDALAPRE